MPTLVRVVGLLALYVFSSTGTFAQTTYENAAQRLVRTFKGHTHTVTSVALSADGKLLASGSFDGTIRLWDTTTGATVRTIAPPKIPDEKGQLFPNTAYSVALSPDGTRVLTGSSDKTVTVWEVATGRMLATFAGHKQIVWTIALSPDGTRVLSGAWDGDVKLWDVASGQELRTLTGHHDKLLSVEFTQDGKRALSGASDGTIRLWDLADGRNLRTFRYGASLVASAVSPDGTRALAGWWDNALVMWDAATGREIFTVPENISDVEFSPNGRYVLAGTCARREIGKGCINPSIKLLAADTGRVVREFKGHTGNVTDLEFSADGRFAFSSCADKTVKMWDVSPWTKP